MSFYADNTVSGKHATSSVCYSIENLLELLNNRRLRLEELWKQRKLKVEQCIQIAYLRADIRKVDNHHKNLRIYHDLIYSLDSTTTQ